MATKAAPPRRARRKAALERCPCCLKAPCACRAECECQELKAEPDEEDLAGLQDVSEIGGASRNRTCD